MPASPQRRESEEQSKDTLSLLSVNTNGIRLVHISAAISLPLSFCLRESAFSLPPWFLMAVVSGWVLVAADVAVKRGKHRSWSRSFERNQFRYDALRCRRSLTVCLQTSARVCCRDRYGRRACAEFGVAKGEASERAPCLLVAEARVIVQGVQTTNCSALSPHKKKMRFAHCCLRAYAALAVRTRRQSIIACRCRIL